MQVMDAQTRHFGETTRAWFGAQTRLLDISVEAYRGMFEAHNPAS
jgi:hypothetical protein